MSQDNNAAAEIGDDDDLNIIFDELIIDQDFNPWSEFRSSIAAVRSRSREGEGDDSLQTLFTRSLTIAIATTRVAKLSADGQPYADTTLLAVDDVDIESLGNQKPIPLDEKQCQEVDDSECQGRFIAAEIDSSPPSDDWPVVFSSLTPGEQRDNRSWNIRLARDKVYSRYYHPEQWELSEMKTIQNFLGIGTTETPCFFSDHGQEISKKGIINIFHPGDNRPKSVLLKRGPILINGGEERDMLLFTHGFVISLVEFDLPLHILFHTNSEKLKDRFIVIDTDLNIVDGTIDDAEFKSVTNELAPPKTERWNWGILGQKWKQSMVGRNIDRKVECAYSYSSITKVESVNICYSEATRVYRNSSWADLIFAIFIEKSEEPLILICSKPEHRSAWVDALCTCCVNSIKLQADNGVSDAKHIRAQPGWQHCIIRASLFSLVCTNSVERLGEHLASMPPDMNINDQDDYRGCSALHYAAILGHIDCAEMLLKHRASVNLEDNDLKTPLDHAFLSENSAMINLLEQYGGKKHASMVLFESAVEEQRQIKSETVSRTLGQKLFLKAKDSSSEMVHGMSALRERGERLERVGNNTTYLYMDASDYAQLAKQMKEKSKTKTKFFGLI